MKNNQRGKTILILTLVVLLLAPFDTSHGEENLKFYIRGERSIGRRLMPFFIEDYLSDLRNMNSYREPQNNSKFSIIGEYALKKETYVIETINSSSVYKDLSDKTSNTYIAMCEAPFNHTQKQLGNWKKYLIALDAMVFITNHKNRFSSISITELTNFLTGKKKSLQNSDDVLNIYIKDKSSVSYEIIKELLKSEEIDTKRITHFTSDYKIINAVSTDNNAIGVINLSSVDKNNKSYKVLKLKQKCVTSTMKLFNDNFSISDKRYPFINEIYLYSNSSNTNKLINFIKTSKKTNETIKKKGFTVANYIFEKSFENQEERFSIKSSEAESLSKTLLFIQDKLKGTKQLASTIYFDKNRSVYSQGENRNVILNKIELTQLNRLAKFIKKKKSRIGEVILIGFADNRGNFNSNKILSEKRAKEVSDYLKNVMKVTNRITIAGLGELANIDCGNDALLNNRRVEVWIKYIY